VLNPAVLLLDEPLGALDAKLRRSLKIELKALQERVGITFLYVTHDQEEALTMSDRLAVMNAGKIVQIGTPREVYEDPADTYVADFLGAANLMEVDVVSVGALRVGDFALASNRCEQTSAGPAHAVIRPERVRIEEHGSAGENRVPAMVERVVFLGTATQVLLRLAPGLPLQALMQNDGVRPDLTQGTPVHVFLPPEALRVLADTARPGGVGTLVYARACDHRGRVGAGRGCRGAGTGGGAGRGRRPPGRDLRDRRRAVHRATGLLRPGQDRLPDPPGSRMVRRGVRARRRSGSRMAGRAGDRGHHARLRALPALRGRTRPRLRRPPGGRHRALAGRAGGEGAGPRL